MINFAYGRAKEKQSWSSLVLCQLFITEKIMKQHRVSLKDLAAQLGVSIATVSRALRNSHEVGEELRLRVQKLAKELTKKMRQAAAELNFEEAAKLRDRMKEVKQMLLELEKN